MRDKAGLKPIQQPSHHPHTTCHLPPPPPATHHTTTTTILPSSSLFSPSQISLLLSLPYIYISSYTLSVCFLPLQAWPIPISILGSGGGLSSREEGAGGEESACTAACLSLPGISSISLSLTFCAGSGMHGWGIFVAMPATLSKTSLALCPLRKRGTVPASNLHTRFGTARTLERLPRQGTDKACACLHPAAVNMTHGIWPPYLSVEERREKGILIIISEGPLRRRQISGTFSLCPCTHTPA